MSYQFREAREKAGLSAAEVGRRIGVSQPAVTQWETGVKVPSVEMLCKLAGIMSMSSMSRMSMAPGSCLIPTAPNGWPLKWNSKYQCTDVKLKTSVHFSKRAYILTLDFMSISHSVHRNFTPTSTIVDFQLRKG